VQLSRLARVRNRACAPLTILLIEFWLNLSAVRVDVAGGFQFGADGCAPAPAAIAAYANRAG
jgi:hypothetical protein